MRVPTGDDRITVAWPFWVLRYLATDDADAFSDAAWSVGGSPPWGGVSRDEAAAVYELLEDYRGPGRAAEAAYAKVEKLVDGDPERSRALAAFAANDEITSAPESFGDEPVRRGLAIAEELDHDGLRCLFHAYRAQLAYKAGDPASARDIALQALKLGLPVAAEDPAYARRMAQLAQNAVSFTALAGHREGAQRLQEQLAGIMDPGLRQEG